MDNPIFAIDTKRHFRERIDDEGIHKFMGLLGVCVNPLDIEKFENSYDSIMNELFSQYDLPKDRMVYKSYDLAKLFKKDFEKKYKSFLIGFSRNILNLDSVKITFFFTEINVKHLEDGKINIFGKYGGPTREVGVEKFMNLISGYYEIICAWKIHQITSIRNAVFMVDGIDSLYPSKAWDELIRSNHIKIHFKGDQINPLLSTSDILIKFLEQFLKERYSPLNESRIEKVLSYDGKVNMDNIFIKYIGNPDLEHIKPSENYRMDFNDVQDYIQRPIIFVGLGDLKGQKQIFEESKMYEKLLKTAIGLNASIRFFDPSIDAKLVGKSVITDYFMPMSLKAEEYFALLKKLGSNVERLDLK